MLKNFQSSKIVHLITLSSMFAIMLTFNILTEKIADDFTYSFSFATGEKISNLGELIDSMIVHGRILNGRYFSHAIVQLLLLLPDIVFDLISSAIFVATIYATYKICNRKRKTDNLFLIAVFGSVWLFEHNFGQVNLWLDGAVNYGFAIIFGLLFILPYLNSFMKGKNLSCFLILPHVALSFWLGGYIEPVAVGFIASAFFFTLLDVILNKNKRALIFIPSLVASLLGFALMVLAPSHAEKKLTSFSVTELLKAAGMSVVMLLSILPIILLYVILTRRAKKENADNRIILSAHVLAIGALASNFVLVFASYFVLRCTVCFIFMSIFATSLLYGSIENRDFGKPGRICGRIFTAVLSLAILVGLTDNIITYSVIKENERIIAEAVEAGEDEAPLNLPRPFTKYNAVKGLVYLTEGDGNAWPNNEMAKYYGLKKITVKK